MEQLNIIINQMKEVKKFSIEMMNLLDRKPNKDFVFGAYDGQEERIKLYNKWEKLLYGDILYKEDIEEKLKQLSLLKNTFDGSKLLCDRRMVDKINNISGELERKTDVIELDNGLKDSNLFGIDNIYNYLFSFISKENINNKYLYMHIQMLLKDLQYLNNIKSSINKYEREAYDDKYEREAYDNKYEREAYDDK
jgi:hypothetical protein